MVQQLALGLVAQVADDFITGNISDVERVFVGLKKSVNAVYLGIAVYQCLQAHYDTDTAGRFVKLIGEWAD